MKIRNLPIFKKIMLVLGAFVLLAIGSTCFATYNISVISAAYSDLIDHEGQFSLYLTRSNRALGSVRSAISDLVLSTTDAGNHAAMGNLADAKKALETFTTRAKAALPERAPIVDQIYQSANQLINGACAKSIELGSSATDTDAIKVQAIFLKECGPQFPVLSRLFTEESDKAVINGEMQKNILKEKAWLTIQVTFAIILTGLLLVVVGAYFTVKAWISVPLSSLNTTMDMLAKGDLTVAIPDPTRKDEIGAMSRTVQVFKDAAIEKVRLEREAHDQRQAAEQERSKTEAERKVMAAQQATVVDSLAAALARLSSGDLTCDMSNAFAPEYERLRTDFNAAVGELRGVVGTIIASTGAIRSGTGEISQAADDLSRRTEQQAASLEETAAALDQITATVRKTAEGANAAQAVVATAKADAEHSGAVVRDAVSAMSAIEQSSREIGQIIGVIDEIAFQTNLLALNAGVEAARAGDAGRGFAVVASEVRALAQRSAQAAKEIKALIGTSTTQVGRGVSLVSETGTVLGRILSQVTQVDGVVSEIAASAQEQASGLAQVNTAVNQMDQVTQQNAAMVEESTAASHSLAQDTAALEQLTARFNVGAQRPDKAAAQEATPRKASRAQRERAGGIQAARRVGELSL